MKTGNILKEIQEILETTKYSDRIELSEEMENIIAGQPFSEIEELKGKLSDRAVRKWYLAHDAAISKEVGQNGTVEQRARRAFELRNLNRIQARELMHDQKKRARLEKTDPNKTFEELILDKMKRKDLSREEAIQDVLDTAGKTRRVVNKMLGLE